MNNLLDTSGLYFFLIYVAIISAMSIIILILFFMSRNKHNEAMAYLEESKKIVEDLQYWISEKEEDIALRDWVINRYEERSGIPSVVVYNEALSVDGDY